MYLIPRACRGSRVSCGPLDRSQARSWVIPRRGRGGRVPGERGNSKKARTRRTAKGRVRAGTCASCQAKPRAPHAASPCPRRHGPRGPASKRRPRPHVMPPTLRPRVRRPANGRVTAYCALPLLGVALAQPRRPADEGNLSWAGAGRSRGLSVFCPLQPKAGYLRRRFPLGICCRPPLASFRRPSPSAREGLTESPHLSHPSPSRS